MDTIVISQISRYNSLGWSWWWWPVMALLFQWNLSLAFFRQKLRKLGHNSCYESNNSTFFEIRWQLEGIIHVQQFTWISVDAYYNDGFFWSNYSHAVRFPCNKLAPGISWERESACIISPTVGHGDESRTCIRNGFRILDWDDVGQSWFTSIRVGIGWAHAIAITICVNY